MAGSGCTAVVREITRRYEDGGLDILVVGLRRFQIQEINDDPESLTAAVSYFNDEETDPAPADVAGAALSGYRRLREFLGSESVEPQWGDPQLSFQLADLISDSHFRQQLLDSRSEAGRIRLLAGFFPRYLQLQSRIRHAESVVPTNGRGPATDLF